jgi:hypothetical protein
MRTPARITTSRTMNQRRLCRGIIPPFQDKEVGTAADNKGYIIIYVSKVL